MAVYSGEVVIDPELNKYISISQSKQLLCIPLQMKEGVLIVGIVDPDHGNVLSSLQFLFGTSHQAYKVYLIPYESFKKHFQVGPLGSASETQKKEDEEDDQKEDPKQSDDEKKKDTNDTTGGEMDLTEVTGEITADIETFSIPDIFSTVLKYAINKGVSDIHVEHMGTTVRIRCRVDGQLETIVSLPTKIHPMLIARVKILCAMKLDEKRKPKMVVSVQSSMVTQ